MRNMNYFCTVKRFGRLITLAIICVISLISNEIYAVNNVQPSKADNDSIEISLLTCAPGKEVYSLYGHTAIRYNDKTKGIDIAINYGMFSFKTPFFIPRFIFGLTDYEMGIIPFDAFCEEYRYEDRDVIQQVLNLTADEKKEIIKAIETNYLPENRIYRYNYFYDNCTTRARDILLNNINGKIFYSDNQGSYPSYRDLIHAFNEEEPWARFGNDLLLGVKADKPTNLKEHQFLPYNLMHDFEKATIKDYNGKSRPLVIAQYKVVKCPDNSQSRPLVIAQDKVVKGPDNSIYTDSEGFPLRPSTCAWIIFCIVLLRTLTEFVLKKRFMAFDAILMTLNGCVGLILFMMFFSKHPTTSTNLQIFLFNPLSLFYLYYVIKRKNNNKENYFWCFAIVSLIIFFIGGLFQDYAEGTYILASSLLIRCISKIIRKKNNDK